MVDVKSDKICRVEIMIDHAKRLKAFLKEYKKKYSYPAGWGDPIDEFIVESRKRLDGAILDAYKKAKKNDE